MAWINPFRPALFRYLKDLRAHNHRDWFQANKERYENDLKDPALTFISDVGPSLRKVSAHFQAIPKAVGGSLFRIYRDTRFAKDKTPYKTHLGIQLRHKRAKDAHAPGYYLHIEPKNCMIGIGLWRPDSTALKGIRSAIATDPKAWKRARDAKRFRQEFQIGGESLKRAPRGFAEDHPFIDDLKRKDFIAFSSLTQKQVTSPELLSIFTSKMKAATPYMRWLCQAVGVDF